MKILFIEPPGYKTVTGKYTPPCGYLYLAAFLKSHGYEDVAVLDAYASGLDWPRIKKYIMDHRPDIVATGSVTVDMAHRFFLLRMAKEIDPSMTTVIGGLHASLNPEQSLRSCPAIDYAMVGEGEVTFKEFADALQGSRDMASIKGLGYLKGNDYVYTGERPLIEDLDSLPMPDYSLVPMERYRLYELPGNAYAGTGVTFSRGCRYRCTFCTEAKRWGYRCRSRGPVKMAEEIALLYERYGKRNFIIGDSDFFYDTERLKGFIAQLERRRIPIRFNVMARVDSVLNNREYLAALRDQGLVTVGIGVESYAPSVLRELDKGQKADQVREACFLIRKARIPVLRLFTLWGHNSEGKDAWRQILTISRSLGADFLTHSILTPYPGTDIFSKFKSAGLIETDDYSLYRFYNPVVHTQHYSRKQMFWIQQLMHFFWWYHPQRFVKALTNRYRFHLQFVYVPRFTFKLLMRLARLAIGRFFGHARAL